MAGRPALPSSSQGLDTLNDYVKRARTIPQPSHSVPPPSHATPPTQPRWIVQSMRKKAEDIAALSELIDGTNICISQRCLCDATASF